MSSTCGLKYFTSCINTFFYVKKTCILIGRVPIFSTKKISNFSNFFLLYNQRFYRGTGVKTLASASAKNAIFYVQSNELIIDEEEVGRVTAFTVKNTVFLKYYSEVFREFSTQIQRVKLYR